MIYAFVHMLDTFVGGFPPLLLPELGPGVTRHFYGGNGVRVHLRRHVERFAVPAAEDGHSALVSEVGAVRCGAVSGDGGDAPRQP